MYDEIDLKYREGRLSILSDKSTGCEFWLYPPLCLTHTELQILYCILQGKSIDDIAEYRNRSSKTIWGQKKHIYLKLGIQSDATIYRDLMQKGIVHFEKTASNDNRLTNV
ncbi:helix-turn-helix transcriptional regulator [Escherichia coli]|uniref:helix-turn-helix transcriptional regulator n=1 Tax=Escherichia coli TaxID=562 RepID=UPI000BDEE5AD|nr:helix-turn-helix domain-containing protein [Escherichia coli]